jgi:hypothetical protein
LEKAFSSPWVLTERLGHVPDAAEIAGMPADELVAIFSKPPALHRFPGSMAKRVQAMCVAVVDRYDNDVSNVWSQAADGAELLKRVGALPRPKPRADERSATAHREHLGESGPSSVTGCYGYGAKSSCLLSAGAVALRLAGPYDEGHAMKARSLLAATAVAGLGAICLAAPASADPTAATVTITAGALSISVPLNAGSLGTQANTVVGGTISGSLGQVEVDDARSAPAGSGWVVSVISTAFTPPAGPTIAADRVGYTAGVISQLGTATYTANDPPDLTGVTPAVTASGITGDNRAIWNPKINVAVPGGRAPGVYSGTITHSVV